MWKVIERDRITGTETVVATAPNREKAIETMRAIQHKNQYAWVDFNRYLYVREDNDG